MMQGRELPHPSLVTLQNSSLLISCHPLLPMPRNHPITSQDQRTPMDRLGWRALQAQVFTLDHVSFVALYLPQQPSLTLHQSKYVVIITYNIILCWCSLIRDQPSSSSKLYLANCQWVPIHMLLVFLVFIYIQSPKQSEKWENVSKRLQMIWINHLQHNSSVINMSVELASIQWVVCA